MGGGGKGGSQTTTTRVELPPQLERAATATLGAGLMAAGLPYAPNRGVTIAAMSPQEQAAIQGANAAAGAFGLPIAVSPDGYLPTPVVAANGMQGYATGALYDDIMTRSMTPEQIAERDRMLAQFRSTGSDIMSGSGRSRSRSSSIFRGGATSASRQARDDGGNFNEGSRANPRETLPGGYTGLRDMVNGGGPGAGGK